MLRLWRRYCNIECNKIQEAILATISLAEEMDFLTPFEYDSQDGFIYHIYDDSKENIIYKFVGTLYQNMPNGEGIAKYNNGLVYRGVFKNGLREGYGQLFDINNKIIREGNWRNDNFFDEGYVEYYPDISVAASVIKTGSSAIFESKTELMIIPNLRKKGLIAFPVVGDSMMPSFVEDDIIIVKPLQSIEDLRENITCVVFHEDHLLLKIIQKTIHDDSIKLWLISENHINNRPFLITPNEKTRFFDIVLHIKKY